jgi:hypothetical protein
VVDDLSSVVGRHSSFVGGRMQYARTVVVGRHSSVVIRRSSFVIRHSSFVVRRYKKREERR